MSFQALSVINRYFINTEHIRGVPMALGMNYDRAVNLKNVGKCMAYNLWIYYINTKNLWTYLTSYKIYCKFPNTLFCRIGVGTRYTTSWLAWWWCTSTIKEKRERLENVQMIYGWILNTWDWISWIKDKLRSNILFPSEVKLRLWFCLTKSKHLPSTRKRPNVCFLWKYS